MTISNRQIAKMLSFSEKHGGFHVTWNTKLMRDEGWKKAEKAFRKIKKSSPTLKIGVQSDEGNYSDTAVSVALVAAWNHFGTKTIPPRPYLTKAMDSNSVELQSFSVKIFKKIMDGASPENALGLLGEKVVSVIRRTITKLDQPPNAPSTIKRKGSSNPLVDTGRLRASQRWALVNKLGSVIKTSPSST